MEVGATFLGCHPPRHAERPDAGVRGGAPRRRRHGIAGTVALQAADPGFRYVLVHATDGGAEDIREEFPAGLRDPLMARGATSESSSTLRCA
jgi:hypothetical protein